MVRAHTLLCAIFRVGPTSFVATDSILSRMEEAPVDFEHIEDDFVMVGDEDLEPEEWSTLAPSPLLDADDRGPYVLLS